MNNPNTTTPAATTTLSTPAKDHAAADQPMQAPKADAAPAKAEAIPTKV